MPTTFGAGKRSAAVATNVLLPLMPFFPWSPPWFATLLPRAAMLHHHRFAFVPTPFHPLCPGGPSLAQLTAYPA